MSEESCAPDPVYTILCASDLLRGLMAVSTARSSWHIETPISATIITSFQGGRGPDGECAQGQVCRGR